MKTNLYLILLLGWLALFIIPAVLRSGRRFKGLARLRLDKSRAAAFLKTGVMVGLFSLVANNNLRPYFWALAGLNVFFAAVITVRVYRKPGPVQ